MASELLLGKAKCQPSKLLLRTASKENLHPGFALKKGTNKSQSQRPRVIQEILQASLSAQLLLEAVMNKN